MAPAIVDQLAELQGEPASFNDPSDVVIENWTEFCAVAAANCVRFSCYKKGEIFLYIYNFLKQQGRSFALWHKPADDFAQVFVLERFRKSANRIYEDAVKAGTWPIALPLKRAAINVIVRYLDYYMRDVDLTSNMIEEIVQRSPALKKFRDGINAGVYNHSLTYYGMDGRKSPKQRNPRNLHDGVELRCGFGKPKDHRANKFAGKKPPCKGKFSNGPRHANRWD